MSTGKIALPLTHRDLTLDEAFDAMTHAGKSGIVREISSLRHGEQRERHFRLYQAKDIVVGIADGKLRLSDVSGQHVDESAADAELLREPAEEEEDLIYRYLPDRTSKPRSASFEFPEMLIRALSEMAQQCYCVKCGRAGAKGAPCQVDGGEVKCR